MRSRGDRGHLSIKISSKPPRALCPARRSPLETVEPTKGLDKACNDLCDDGCSRRKTTTSETLEATASRRYTRSDKLGGGGMAEKGRIKDGGGGLRDDGS